MSGLVNVNLKLKDGRSIMVTVDEENVDRFSNGPDKLLDALAEKYPHDLPTKPVYISVQENMINLSEDKTDANSEDVHNSSANTGKDRRFQPGSFHWERDDVLALIRHRSEKESIFNQFGIRKKDVWVMIAEEFQQKGFNVTSGQCEQKWKNITKNYRDTVDYSYFSNTHRECPYFKELSAVYPYNPKEKHSGQQSGLSMSGLGAGSSGLGAKNNTTGATVTSSEEFSNYPDMETPISSSGRPSENIAGNFQQDTYLQEVPPDISVDALFQTPEQIKQEIIEDDDDHVIVIPSSPPPLPPPVHTMVPTSMAPNRASPIFQARSLPQMSHTSSITSQGNIPSLSSILSSLSSPSSVPVSIAQSVVKQEPMSVTVSQQYSSHASNVCLQPQIPETLRTQQMNSAPQTSYSSVHSLPSHSSTQPQQHQTRHVNPSSQTRKRPRENTAFSTPSGSSVSDMLAYRRRLLRRTSFSMPNNMLDMLKQMNDERRREHRTLLNTMSQQHEDLLDLFKQHQQEYLHQEEIKQALLTELIERMSKH